MSEQNLDYDFSNEMDEIWALFFQESTEALDLAEETLLELEKDPTLKEQIAALFRAMHTFKGLARTMGLSVIEAVGHRAEDLVGLVRDEGVVLTTPMINLLLTVLDQSRALLTHVQSNQTDVSENQVEVLISQLEAMYQACTSSPPAPAAKAATQAAVPPAQAAQAANLRGEESEARSTDLDGSSIFEAEVVAVAATAAEPDLAVWDEASATETTAEIDEIDTLTYVPIMDPATDPEYVQIFLTMAQEEMLRLNAAFENITDEASQAEAVIQDVTSSLTHAAQQMGYVRLVVSLEQISGALSEADQSAKAQKLQQAQLKLFEELAVIQEISGSEAAEDTNIPNFAWLFRRWHAEQVFADLARMGEITSDLDQVVEQFKSTGGAASRGHQLADEASHTLQAVYHSCVFYKIEEAAHLTLALEDLYARAGQGEMVINEKLITLTQSYISYLGGAIEDIREGETPDLQPIEAMLRQATDVLAMHTEGSAAQVTRDVLDLLDLPPDFKEVATPENLIEIGQALQAGEFFYTILANLEQDETISLAFFDWLRADVGRVITNVTVYQDNQSLFNFLLATTKPEAELQKALTQIDPTGKYLLLTRCTLRNGVDPGQVQPQQTNQAKVGRNEPVSNRQQDPGKLNKLNGFLETIGKLLTSQATLHGVSQRLAEADPAEALRRLIRQANGDWQTAWPQIQKILDAWNEDSQLLSQIDAEIGAGLGQLHEMALALRTQPVAGVLTGLEDLVKETAQHQGKVIDFQVAGAETELDEEVVEILADSLQPLVWLLATYSLETPEQRRLAGKSNTGQISLDVKKQQDRVQIVITDNGRGLEKEGAAALDEADDHKLDLASRLAEIQASLQAHQGTLTVSHETGIGTRLVIELPLSMVVLDGLVVRVGQIHYVVPIGAVNRIVKPQPDEIVLSSADGGHRLLRLAENLIPIQHLIANGHSQNGADELMLVVERHEQTLALPVNELIGQQQVLTQPLYGHLAHVSGVSGCALLGDGAVGMILDLNSL
ncbi:MAG TPA: chemotaxis protein CheW [Anaerolineae bacterium]|nr:chemotaxis protein CheW [Anaerolineae bacterium]